MGLNLLELLPLRLPSLDVDVRQLQAPPLLQARPLHAILQFRINSVAFMTSFGMET